MSRFEWIMALRERGVFHRCECLNQDFYEGDELPEAFYNGKQVVYTFKGFNFNFKDVCLNPEAITYEYKGASYKILIAEKHEGCFISGYEVTSSVFGMFAMPVFHDEGFKSRNEAIVDVFRRLLKFHSLDAGFSKKMINKYSNIQLSLFDD